MKIIIIGGGFAGIAAVKHLKKVASVCSIKLFDTNPYTTFLPELNEFLMNKIPAPLVKRSIKKCIPPYVSFINEQVESIDFDKQLVITDTAAYSYDYCILACGTKPSRLDASVLSQSFYTLHSFSDASLIQKQFQDYLKTAPNPTAIIINGEFYGLQLACSLKSLSHRVGVKCDIIVVESELDILLDLPRNVRTLIKAYFNYRQISIMPSSVITSSGENDCVINSTMSFQNPFLCMCKNDSVAISQTKGSVQKTENGRFVVNEHLQIAQYPNVFVAGDSSAFMHKNKYVRRAVTFAKQSGALCGRNCVRLIVEDPLEKYKPIEYERIIHLDHLSIGTLFGLFHVQGSRGIMLYYLLAGFRTRSLWRSIVYVIISLYNYMRSLKYQKYRKM